MLFSNGGRITHAWAAPKVAAHPIPGIIPISIEKQSTCLSSVMTDDHQRIIRPKSYMMWFVEKTDRPVNP